MRQSEERMSKRERERGKRKPGEKEAEGKERARQMNNKCTMLESIFKGRLEESGCKLGCSHDPSED